MVERTPRRPAAPKKKITTHPPGYDRWYNRTKSAALARLKEAHPDEYAEHLVAVRKRDPWITRDLRKRADELGVSPESLLEADNAEPAERVRSSA